jgi:hypothetical protein
MAVQGVPGLARDALPGEAIAELPAWVEARGWCLLGTAGRVPKSAACRSTHGDAWHAGDRPVDRLPSSAVVAP